MVSIRTLAIIVNWNGTDVLEQTIESLRTSDSPPTDILVVDNASTDDSWKSAVDRFPEVEVIRLTENRGFAGGHNEGLRRAIAENYDFALLLNNDVTLETTTLSRLLETAGINPQAAIVAPSVWRADDRRRLDAAWGNILFHHVIVQMCGVGQIPSVKHLQEREVDCVFGSVLLIRVAVLLQAGLLDERYWMFLEEVEFCRRMKQAGYRILYSPRARAVHVGGHSIQIASAQRLKTYLIRRNSVLFMRRYGGGLQWLWYLICVAGSLVASLAVSLLQGNGRAWKARWEGYRDGFSGRFHPPLMLWKKYVVTSPGATDMGIAAKVGKKVE